MADAPLLPLMTQSGHPTDPGWSLAVLLVMRTFLYTIHPSSRLVVGELPGPFEELCLGHWDVAIILRREVLCEKPRGKRKGVSSKA